MKNLYLSVLCLLFACTEPCLSQEINAGARTAALGNSGVALGDVWSLQSNQAGLVNVKSPSASIDYRNEFMNREISSQSLVFAAPFGRNVLGISLQRYGFSSFTEQKLGLSYAKAFGENLALALNLNYHQLAISQYGSASKMTAELGFQCKPLKGLVIGGHMANPFQSDYNTEVAAIIPVRFELGASYIFSDKVLLNTGFVKVLNSVTSLRTGLEYSILNSLALRGGLATGPFKQFAGLGYKFSRVKIDAAVSSQAILGYSPQVAIGYDF